MANEVFNVKMYGVHDKNYFLNAKKKEPTIEMANSFKSLASPRGVEPRSPA